jgi:hypothetical protein
LPIKNEWQNALLLFPTLSVRSPSWNYFCVCSRHLMRWLLLLSGGEHKYWLNLCLPTQCRNPFSGNKIGNLTFWLALVQSTPIYTGSLTTCSIFGTEISELTHEFVPWSLLPRKFTT